MPTEGGMILKRLMTVTNDCYVKRTTVTTKGLHVILDVELYPFEPEPVVRIIEKLEERQYINALELDRLRKAGMRHIYDREKFLKRPLYPKTSKEIRERLYRIRPHLQVNKPQSEDAAPPLVLQRLLRSLLFVGLRLVLFVDFHLDAVIIQFPDDSLDVFLEVFVKVRFLFLHFCKSLFKLCQSVIKEV